jgi:hypothetical protein
MPNVPDVPGIVLNPQTAPPKNPTSAASVSAPSLQKVTNAIIVIIMVLVITVMAGFDKNLGRLLTVFMSGVALMWLIGPGYQDIKKWIAPISPGAANVGVVQAV